MKAFRSIAWVLGLVLLPLFLGQLIVGPSTPVGRNGDSVTGIGHKAYRLLLEELGYDVQKFGHGVEGLPPLGRSAFFAIEPGPLLLREQGAYAQALLRWVEAGNSALLTFGPDPDRAAETEDRSQLFGQQARRAIDAAQAVEKAAQARARPVEGSTVAAAGREAALDESESWPAERLAVFLGIDFREDRLPTATTSVPLTGPWAAALGDSPRLDLTRPRVLTLGSATASVSVVLEADGHPLVIEQRRGRGRILVLAEPRLLHNAAIGRAVHARLGAALAEHLFGGRGPRVIHLEEWSHGRSDADSLGALVLQTRLKWLLLQICLVALAWVALVAPRRRSAVPLEVPPRRSKEEVIDAIATLHFRSGDVEGAGQALVALSRRRLARMLWATRETPSDAALAQALAQRLGGDPAELLALFQPDLGTSKAFVARARALLALRRALLLRRSP